MDDDPAGNTAIKQLSKLSLATQFVQVPRGKDINEFHLSMGSKKVHTWLLGLS